MKTDVQTVILHDGGLASGLLVGMATKMYDPHQIAIVTYNQTNDRKFKASVDLARHYEIENVVQRNIVRPLDRAPAKLTMIIETSDMMRKRYPNARALVMGEHIKTGMKGNYTRMELWHNVVNDLHNGFIHLHTPFLALKESEIIEKTVDYALPLELVRDCIANTEKFCGECHPCRVRINAFKEVGFMDWEYEHEIDFDLSPSDQKDYDKYLAGDL